VRDIELLDEAREELAESISFYEEREPGLRLDFAQAVEEALTVVHANPELWSPRKNGFRRYLIDRFPFILHYRIESDTREIYRLR